MGWKNGQGVQQCLWIEIPNVFDRETRVYDRDTPRSSNTLAYLIGGLVSLSACWHSCSMTETAVAT